MGGSQKFEKKFKVQLGNKTLDEVRKEYGINGMNSIREVMPTIENYTGFLNQVDFDILWFCPKLAILNYYYYFLSSSKTSIVGKSIGISTNHY